MVPIMNQSSTRSFDRSSGMSDTIFTMKGDSDTFIPPIAPVPLSYSSAESGADYASLLGEAIVSKDTAFTVEESKESSSSFPSIFPICHPLYPETEVKPLDSTNGISQQSSSVLLPPLSDGSASPIREPIVATRDDITLESTKRHSTDQSEFLDVIGCPCCQQNWDTGAPIRIDALNLTSSLSETVLPKKQMRDQSLLTAADSDDDEEEVLQIDEDLMTGVLKEGVQYRITRIIVEGWLHKKGTGHDWMGSRGWKARWARLAVGIIDGYGNVEVPMLGISWYPTSANNSTVIVLDSTVVLAVDLPNKDKAHRFEIRHASSRLNSSLPVTRTFTAASRKARDAWVYAISQALLSYEKEKAAIRKYNPTNAPAKPPPPQVPNPRDFEDNWMIPPGRVPEQRSSRLDKIVAPKLARHVSANPAPPRPRNSISPSIVIGHEGIGANTKRASNDRGKPFALNTRSTSV
jgi:PH domain